MIKKCKEKDCNIIYETTWQDPINKKTENKIIKDYIYKIIMKEKIKNEGKFGVGRTIIQFLQQEADKLSS
jgi:hypothetical protein|tara:strand:- start:2166 stop:2375 length:210 start_codon:yes stop_codon:yes gene_type:complete